MTARAARTAGSAGRARAPDGHFPPASVIDEDEGTEADRVAGRGQGALVGQA
jgi:hypothetical protein